MIDLGASKSVKTVHVITSGNQDGTGFNSIATSYFYVGNDNTSPSKNTLCNT